MSDNDRDSDENVQSYHKVPVKPVRKRIISEPAKKKTTDTLKRKVRTIQSRTKVNKSKQEARSKYAVAEQNADYVTQKLLAARKEKINELRNEIVDLQRQHKELTRKLELLDKNYKRDIIAEKVRQKELLNEKKNLQKDYDKLQFSLSLKEKKIEQQNIYFNLRKQSSNMSQVVHSSYPENKQVPPNGETPKQASNESSVGSIKDKRSIKELSKEKCDNKLINWHEKAPSRVAKRLFSTPLTESRDVHSEYEKMASFLNRSSPVAEQSAGSCNVSNESERPRFEKRLDSKTKERLLSHLKALNISDKEFSAVKEESGYSDPVKRLSSSICIPETVDNLIFNSYVPSLGDSSRHSAISNIQNPNLPLGSHSIFGSGCNISSLSKSHSSKEKDKSGLKMSVDSYEEKMGRGPGPR